MSVHKILVVDDSKLLHKMYEVMLRQHTLVYALNGHEALQALVEHPDVELILLDINMPRMNGLEFLELARSNPVTARIPVIVVSTEGREADAQRALQAGAQAYVTKPFRNETLAEQIARVVVEAGAA